MTNKNKTIEAMDKAYRMEKRAIESKTSHRLEVIPFYWIFEDFCKKNGISCDFDSVGNEYILTYK